MARYTGYSKKGLKRTISGRKFWRIFNNDPNLRRTMRTYYKDDKQITIGAYTHNGYVYCQEISMSKKGSSMCYYKVSLLQCANL